jgi:hypothetical protein
MERNLPPSSSAPFNTAIDLMRNLIQQFPSNSSLRDRLTQLGDEAGRLRARRDEAGKSLGEVLESALEYRSNRASL